MLDCNGYFLPGWPQTPRDASVRSVEVTDIDSDGKKEILFNSYNGKVHCFSLEKKEPYAWPYA